jgi:hypothetical protein
VSNTRIPITTATTKTGENQNKNNAKETGQQVTRARGSVKKLAPSNYQIRIGYTENGKRREYKRQNFATKRDADIALANAQVTLGKGRAIDASRQTLGVFLDGWLDIYAKSRGVKPSTLAKTREHLRAYIVPRLGAKSMRELKPHDVRDRKSVV